MMKLLDETSQAKPFNLTKDKLETQIHMINLCSELIELYKNKQDETSYQKLLYNHTEEKLQTFCYFLQNNFPTSLTYYNTKIIQLFEMLKSPEFERFKLLILIKGPELLNNEGIITKFIENQQSQIKDISGRGNELQNLKLSYSYWRDVRKLEKSFEIEQEIFDLNEELYHVPTLEGANSLIDTLLSKLNSYTTYTNNYSTSAKSFWLDWLNCSLSVLTKGKEDTVSKLYQVSKFKDWFKKVLGLLWCYLMITFVYYIIYLLVDYPTFQSYGRCEHTQSNLESIKKHGLIPHHIFSNDINVYGETGFFYFFKLFGVLPLMLTPFYMIGCLTCRCGERELERVANRSSTKLIVNRLFWSPILRLLYPGWIVLFYIIFYANEWYYKRIMTQVCP